VRGKVVLSSLCSLLLTISFVTAADEASGSSTVEPRTATISPESRPGRSLAETQKRLGAALYWDPLSRRGEFVLNSHRLAFIALEEGVNVELPFTAISDGNTLLSVPAPRLYRGELRFDEAFIEEVAATFERKHADDASRFRIAAIVVDPGHGGKDTGAVASQLIGGKKVELVEKDLVLEVAKDLYARLGAAYPDKKIVLSRTGDTYPTLEDRVAFAHSIKLADNEAVIFVSVHANASFNKKARGFEVWYLSPEYRRTVIDKDRYAEAAEVIPILNAMMEEEYTTESVMIAKSILSRLDERIGAKSPSRGVKAEEWFVVRNARMPSVLVEIGFVTNPEDGILLSDPAYLQNISEAIYTGVADYVSVFERSGGFTASR